MQRWIQKMVLAVLIFSDGFVWAHKDKWAQPKDKRLLQKNYFFQGMRGLVEVKIADAKISQVSATVFSGLRKLKRLSLYKNNITVLAKVSK